MKCPKGRVKRRVSKHRGHPSNYAHSLRGHSWKRLYNEDGVHIGRQCINCGYKYIIPEFRKR